MLHEISSMMMMVMLIKVTPKSDDVRTTPQPSKSSATFGATSSAASPFRHVSAAFSQTWCVLWSGTSDDYADDVAYLRRSNGVVVDHHGLWIAGRTRGVDEGTAISRFDVRDTLACDTWFVNRIQNTWNPRPHLVPRYFTIPSTRMFASQYLVRSCGMQFCQKIPPRTGTNSACAPCCWYLMNVMPSSSYGALHLKYLDVWSNDV